MILLFNFHTYRIEQLKSAGIFLRWFSDDSIAQKVLPIWGKRNTECIMAKIESNAYYPINPANMFHIINLISIMFLLSMFALFIECIKSHINFFY